MKIQKKMMKRKMIPTLALILNLNRRRRRKGGIERRRSQELRRIRGSRVLMMSSKPSPRKRSKLPFHDDWQAPE